MPVRDGPPNVYLASPDPRSGKSAIAVGLLEEKKQRFEQVGVFRPIVRSDGVRDHVLQMLLDRLDGRVGYDDAVGVTYADLASDPDASMSRIVDKFHALAHTCDAVLVVGSDYTDVVGPMEFGYNAAIAANLGAPIILVISGLERTAAQIARATTSAMTDARVHHAEVLSVIANRVEASAAAEVASALAGAASPGTGGVGTAAPTTFVVPEDAVLAAPTVGALSTAVHGRPVLGSPAALDRVCLDVVVAADSLREVVPQLRAGISVLVAHDRLDVLLGLALWQAVPGIPRLAALFVSGAHEAPAEVEAVIAALWRAAGVDVPLIAIPDSTTTAARRLLGFGSGTTGFSASKLDTALAHFNKHVDTAELIRGSAAAVPGTTTPLMFEHMLAERARAADRHIVLPEGAEPRILKAAAHVLRRGMCRITLLGDPREIADKAAELGVDVSGAAVIDPASSELLPRFASEYVELRKHKLVPYDQALDHCTDVSYFGTMMVLDSLADGMVSGAAHTTAHTIRPALEVIRTAPGVSVVSSVFFMCLADRVLVYGDCAVNPDPNADQLADIAISSARTATEFGIPARVAMLSYATGDSGSGADVEKVREATEIVRRKAPQLVVEGPIQYDAAVDPTVGQQKMPGSAVAGQATVLIFPSLTAGNAAYKAVQRSAGAVAIGPVLQGLNRPINDLSRGALVEDIVNTVAITAIQAQE